MGTEGREIIVIYTVSRHNSEQDVIDDQLGADLWAEIEKVVLQEKYEGICAWVDRCG
jgi:hypothetical protein